MVEIKKEDCFSQLISESRKEDLNWFFDDIIVNAASE